MKVRIKKLNENAVIPQYAHATDAGMDLTAISKELDDYGNIVYGTGLAFEIPEGYVGLLFPRSSNYKKALLLSNCVGVIDSGYRGEVTFKYASTDSACLTYDEWNKLGRNVEKSHKYDAIRSVWHDEEREYAIGDRIGQLIIMPYPHIEFEEVQELTETERGEGGYGSTGK